MKIAICTCATKSYSYALIAQARRVIGCIQQEPEGTTGLVILVGDDSKPLREASAFYKRVLPPGWEIQHIVGNHEDGLKNYKNPAQLVIAQMRSVAFDAARKANVDVCWSIDSDVLPQPNALKCMRLMLEFDDGYYSVSTCPYPSQGGGDFLGGRGTPENPILPDIYDDEYEVSKPLEKRMKRHMELLQKLKGRPNDAWLRERQQIALQIRRCKPKADNVWGLNARNFRRRGWLSAAYPGIGIGAVLPSDWCGFGCTLMSRRALSLAQFDGYDGGGTEDLYVVWKKWFRHGLKINVIPHCPADHVVRDSRKKRKYILCQAFHESRDPECVGHLRQERRPWYQQSEHERFSALNDGQMADPRRKRRRPRKPQLIKKKTARKRR